MNLFYAPQMLCALPETEFGGYLVGFSNRLNMGFVGAQHPSLDERQTSYVREQTYQIMQRIYATTLFPVDHRNSIDDLLVVSVLFGDQWHIGLHRGLNRGMREIGFEHLY